MPNCLSEESEILQSHAEGSRQTTRPWLNGRVTSEIPPFLTGIISAIDHKIALAEAEDEGAYFEDDVCHECGAVLNDLDAAGDKGLCASSHVASAYDDLELRQVGTGITAFSAQPVKTLSLPSDTPVRLRDVIQHSYPKPRFRVYKNGELAQEGFDEEIKVKFSNKKISIVTETSTLQISREVKTAECPQGKITLSVEGYNAEVVLKDQLSRAWWFGQSDSLVFVTTQSQVYLLRSGELVNLGSLALDTYGLSCALEPNLKRVVFGSRFSEFQLFGIDEDSSDLFGLPQVPQNLWDAIMSLQFSTLQKPDLTVDPPMPDALADVPLSHLRWFEYRIERALLKLEIVTVGDLLSKDKQLVTELVKFRDGDLEGLEGKITAHLQDSWYAQPPGELMIGVWSGLCARGWVEELPPVEGYSTPQIIDTSYLQDLEVPVRIMRVAYEGGCFSIETQLGVCILLDSALKAVSVEVGSWQPNMFKLRLNRRLELLSRNNFPSFQ
jgi:hypothetical protein